MENELPPPRGAIWIRGFNLRERIKRFMAKRGVALNDDDLREIFMSSHTLAVKISSYREKYLAIENSKKKRENQPDYFIHLYQEYTGATPEYPFGNKRPKGMDETEECGIRAQDSLRGTQHESEEATGVQMGGSSLQETVGDIRRHSPTSKGTDDKDDGVKSKVAKDEE